MARAKRPYLLPATTDGGEPEGVRLTSGGAPPDELTLGHLGIATRVAGPQRLSALLVQPYTPEQARGIELASVRTFRLDRGRFAPVWNSGINVGEGFCWTQVSRPGTYVPIGLPRDRLLKTLLHQIATARATADDADGDEFAEEARARLAPFLAGEGRELHLLRRALLVEEMRTAAGPPPTDAERAHGGHVDVLPLPHGASPAKFRQRLEQLDGLARGLPEERLLLTPEQMDGGDLPWPQRTAPAGESRIDEGLVARVLRDVRDLRPLLPWAFSQDWPMYQHDISHSGRASGASNIRATSASRLILQSRVQVDGPVITKPSIAGGKVYVGSSRRQFGPGGTLHKIDIATGAVEGRFPTPNGAAFYPSFQGIGGSPAIAGGKAYFTAVHGTVYCVDTATMTPNAPHPPALWATSLSDPDQSKNQPMRNPDADSWSSPLVVNNRVYVGCGEGESEPTYGFVVCLDATNGHVVWVFCASKFTNRLAYGQENQPNVIPSSNAVSDPLPAWATAAGFSLHPDPITANPDTTRSSGCSVWSSCAYDRGLDRIYVGTGNSQYDPGFTGTELPDDWYGSGLLSLDARTGQFRAFFQPAVEDSYWPGDADIDVPGSPTLFTLKGQRVVAFGSKNGSFFVLDANTLQPVARRQMLPRQNGSGVPGDRGQALNNVVPTGGHGENKWGIMGTPALDAARGRLYIGIGGYDGMTLAAGPGSSPLTPFLRAVNWDDLLDAWPTAVGSDGVARYTTTTPPMYQTREVGLSSPAVVNDLVFVSTNRSGLFALRADNGLCVWSAPSLPQGQFVLGPAISGDRVVVGAGGEVFIYTLRARLVIKPTLDPIPDLFDRPLLPDPPPDIPRPPPGPGPDPVP